MTSSGSRRRTLHALAALPLAAAAAACSSGAGSTGSAPQSAAGPVTVTFWGWNPAYEEAVNKFNATHPDVQVRFEKIVSGSKGGYAKVFAAVKAGNAPCLAQVGNESLPSFLVEGALQDVGKEAAQYKGAFANGAWQQVTVGGAVYGIPVDMGPMAMFYRTDVYAKYGLQPQATWDQLATDAAKVHQADPNAWLTEFNPDDPWWFAGVSEQAGGNWFATSGDSWQVSLADAGTTKVAKYWQDLVARGVVKSEQSFTPDVYKEFQNGTVAAYVGPVWYSSILEQNAAGASGKWAVAPMPQWQAGGNVSGNDGGSTTAVVKGCQHSAQALKFANWMSTDPESLDILIKKAGIYPAATAGATQPALSQPDPYFGGQKIFDVFKQSLTGTPTGWNWGPTMTQTSADLTDAFGAATTAHTPLDQALTAVQDKTVAAMKAKGLNVSGH